MKVACCVPMLAAGLFAVGLFTIAGAPAWAADATTIAEGMRIFHSKANCQACHGFAGDGRKTDNQMPDGANLRDSKLDRDALVVIIKCGLPGTGMPAYDRLAYSDGRCHGLTKSDLAKQGTRLFDAPATLQPREVEMVADFLLERIVGKGALTRASCTELAGGDEEACRGVK